MQIPSEAFVLLEIAFKNFALYWSLFGSPISTIRYMLQKFIKSAEFSKTDLSLELAIFLGYVTY